MKYAALALFTACSSATPPTSNTALATAADELLGVWEDATYQVIVEQNETARVTTKTPGASARAATWNPRAHTITIGERGTPTPIHRVAEALVLVIDGTEQHLPVQPTEAELSLYSFANQTSSLELRGDHSCVVGAAGVKTPCTWKYVGPALEITTAAGPETWDVWFSAGAKVMHHGAEALPRTRVSN